MIPSSLPSGRASGIVRPIQTFQEALMDLYAAKLYQRLREAS
jgi:hypothetical protein